jgi:protein-disulfide isomerase
MDKRFWGIIAVIAVVLGGIFFITSDRKASAPGSSSVSASNHVKNGGANSVKLTEYGDFQCPACGMYYPLVEQIADTYKDQLTFQFRNFPLSQIHPNAIAGARAAEAADMQGKFWQMYDKLYQENGLYYQAQKEGKAYQTWIGSTTPLNEFTQYASELSLDVNKFKQDYASKTVNDRVQADVREGNRLKVNSTPTFFIDGKKISNPNSQDAFKKVIETAIEQKTGKKPTTSSPAATEQAPAAPAAP